MEKSTPSSCSMNLPIKNSRILSKQLETYCRQLDEQIRTATDLSECENLIKNLSDAFILSLEQRPLDIAIEEYKKIATFLAKYSLPYLVVIRASRHPHPLNQFNIDLISKFKDLIATGSYLLLEQLIVDERYVCRNAGIEETIYQRLLDARTFIQHLLLSYYNQFIRTNLLMAYHLLTQAVFDEKAIEKRLNISDETILILQQLKQTPLTKPSARYQLEKTKISSLYLKAKLETLRGNTVLAEKYAEEIRLFLMRHQAEIRQDLIMNADFGYPEVMQYLEQIATQAIKPKKKKSKKKKSSSIAILEDALETASVLPLEDDSISLTIQSKETESSLEISKVPLPDTPQISLLVEKENICDKWQRKCSDLIQNLQAMENPSESEILFVQTIQTLISKLNQVSYGVAHWKSSNQMAQSTYPDVWNKKQENNDLDLFIEKYDQIILKIKEQTTQETPYSKILDIISIVIEIGVYCTGFVRDEISGIADNIKDIPHLFMSLHFQPQLFIGKPNSCLEHLIEGNSKLLVHILNGIEIYADLHFSIINSILHATSLDIHCEETVQAIEQHLKATIHFNKQIYPELHHQQSDRALFYILEKIRYKTAHLQSNWERRQNNIDRAEQIEQRALPFLQAYTDLIANDERFFIDISESSSGSLIIKHPTLSPTETEPENFQELEERLKSAQKTFAERLKEHLNGSNFEYFCKDQFSEIKRALLACFQIHYMNFTTQQVENMVRFIRTFSFYSLSCLYEQPTPFINERSTLVLCGLIEILINVVHTFILNIHAQITSKKNLESTTLFNHATPLIHVLITSAIFASRTYLMLAQAMMDSNGRINTSAVKKYLAKSNKVSEKLVTEFAHVIQSVNAFNYQFYYLEELHTTIRAKLENYLGNPKGCQILEQQIIAQRQERKEKFPHEYTSDRFLTPSYGYEEYICFMEWVNYHANEAKLLENRENSAASNKKKKQKAKKIASMQASPQVTESSMPMDRHDNPVMASDISITSDTSINVQDNPIATPDILIDKHDSPITAPDISHNISDTSNLDVLQPLESPLHVEQCIEAKNNTQISPVSVVQFPWDPYVYETERLPVFCLTNEGLNQIFVAFVSIVNKFFSDGTVYMYGSGLFKNNPADWDLCILQIRTPEEMTRVNRLIEHLIMLGAKVKPKDKIKNEYGYHDNGRHTIEMIWAGVKIEMTLSPKVYFSEFIDDLDYDVCAMGYHFIERKVVQRIGLDGWANIDNRVLNTVKNPIEVFTRDPSRILRGIRLIATKHFDFFSASCLEALKILFNGERNLFLAEHIELHVLIRHLKRLLQLPLPRGKTNITSHTTDEPIAMRTLWNLKLLPKLIERLEIDRHRIEPIYLDRLLRYHAFFQNERNHHYIRPQAYQPFFFPLAPSQASSANSSELRSELSGFLCRGYAPGNINHDT